MRYQALGRACKRLKSFNLLVGHHYDDQVETVLSRLATGHTRLLSGIRKINNIPECYGLHGISESGSCLPRSFSKLLLSCGVAGIEQGGVQIVRPLLNFSKSRLVATCQKYGMAWFEDETNNDKTLTPRNAIRHILQSYRLPEALGCGSIIRLSKSKQQSDDTARHLVDTLFDQLPLKLDIRSGVVTVQFRGLNFERISEALSHGQPRSDRDHTVAQMLIHRVASLVSPGEDLSLGSFHSAVEHVFGMRSSGGKTSLSRESLIRKRSGPKPSFEASGVLFDRLDSKLNSSGESSMNWRCSRAPIVRKPLRVSHAVPKSSRMVQRMPPTSEVESDQEHVFKLWDGRFWIHVHNPSKHDLWVRPLDEASLSSLRSLLAERKVILRSSSSSLRGREGVMRGADKQLDELLKIIAMGKIRWTLPVIGSDISMTTRSTSDGEAQIPAPKVLAFPTLGLRVERLNDGLWPDWVADLKWEVRYKKIDLGTKRVEDCLAGYGQKARSGGARMPIGTGLVVPSRSITSSLSPM
jgi:tRNA(Ile)-lysidine synthase